MINHKNTSINEALKIISNNKCRINSIKQLIMSNIYYLNCNNLADQLVQYLNSFDYDLKTLTTILEYFESIYQNLSTNLDEYVLKESNQTIEIHNLNRELSKYQNDLYNLQKENQSLKNFDLSNYKQISKNDLNYNNYPTDTSIQRNIKVNNDNIQKTKKITEPKKNLSTPELIENSIKKSSVMKSKRINNSIKRMAMFENSKDKKDKIESIIQELNEDENKLNDLKKNFGNNIENQLLNGDINYDYLQQIEDYLNSRRGHNSIVSASKRYLIQNQKKLSSKRSNSRKYRSKNWS